MGFKTRAEMLLWSGEQKWQSPKARETELVKILPPEICLNQTTVKAEDEKNLKRAMLAVLDRTYPEVREGCEVGLRTCFVDQPIGRDWIMGIRSRNQVTSFFKDKNNVPTTWTGSKDHYPDWKADYNLTEVIVMSNYPRLDSPGHRQDFFVCRIFLEYPLPPKNEADFFSDPQASFQPQIVINLMPNTNYLRDLDLGTKQSSIIHIEPPNNHPELPQEPSITYGSQYRHQNNQPFSQIENLAQNVSDIVFWQWNNEYHLQSRLEALEHVGAEAIECQGIKDKKGNVKSIRVYGLRGVFEIGREFGSNHRSRSKKSSVV